MRVEPCWYFDDDDPVMRIAADDDNSDAPCRSLRLQVAS